MTTDLVPVDKTAASVLTVLENAQTWVSTAVDMTGPEEFAAAKAQIRTTETYARELHLSKDIQQDIQEVVRRIEYGMGRSIRRGQAEGTIRKPGDDCRVDLVDRNDYVPLASATDYASKGELYGNGAGLMNLAAADRGEFESVLKEARIEGDLSRANVARKVKKLTPATRDKRADLIEELAQQGYSSRQMPSKVGVTEEVVRRIARDYDITIPADRSMAKTRRIDSTNVVVNTATALEGLVSGVELIDYAALDIAEVRQWATSLTDSMRTLNRFVKQIREVTQ